MVETCAPGLACGSNATCVPACQAAAEHGLSIGCDYYAVAPDVLQIGRNACFAVFVVNASNTAVAITVDRDGVVLPIDRIARVPQGQGQSVQYVPLEDGALQPNDVAIVFLAGLDCPVATMTNDAALHGTGRGKAFHITTSAPVVAYDMYPYAGGALATSSATLLFPTKALAPSYIAVDAFRASAVVADASPVLAIVGTQDDTTVTIVPVAPIEAGDGIAATPQGVPVSYELAHGEVLQFTQRAELAGSTITSTRPVGVWGGATCLSVDVGDRACDSAHQQIPPVRALGHRYAAVRYRDRFVGQDEVVPWRLIGIADGTLLSYSPSKPSGAPDVLARGQVAEFWAPGPFTIESQDADHAFYVAAYMTGCTRITPEELQDGDCRGDPEFVNVIPIDQFVPGYSFFTDPTFPETNLVFVRQKVDGVFADVSLDCAGSLSDWHPVDAAGQLEYARFDLVTGAFAPNGACDNGRHIATSNAPFGLTVWGWGSGATSTRTTTNSYAYPAGGGVSPINDVVLE